VAEQLSEELRNELIRSVQGGVPLVERPFAAIAQTLGLGEPGEAAVMREMTANGSAKIVCLKAIISPVSTRSPTTRDAISLNPAIGGPRR